MNEVCELDSMSQCNKNAWREFFSANFYIQYQAIRDLLRRRTNCFPQICHNEKSIGPEPLSTPSLTACRWSRFITGRTVQSLNFGRFQIPAGSRSLPDWLAQSGPKATWVIRHVCSPKICSHQQPGARLPGRAQKIPALNPDYSTGIVAVIVTDEYQAERSEISSSESCPAITDMISCTRLPDRKALSWVCR